MCRARADAYRRAGVVDAEGLGRQAWVNRQDDLWVRFNFSHLRRAALLDAFLEYGERVRRLRFTGRVNLHANRLLGCLIHEFSAAPGDWRSHYM